jgi:hypothetical protein
MPVPYPVVCSKFYIISHRLKVIQLVPSWHWIWLDLILWWSFGASMTIYLVTDPNFISPPVCVAEAHILNYFEILLSTILFIESSLRFWGTIKLEILIPAIKNCCFGVFLPIGYRYVEETRKGILVAQTTSIDV